MTPPRPHAVVGAALCLAALAVAAAPASAHPVVSIEGTTLKYTEVESDGRPSANRLTIRPINSRRYKITDPGANGGIDFGPCTPVTEHEIDCDGTFELVVVSLEDLDDQATMSVSIPTQVRGGNGQDTIRGGSAPDTIDGEAGNDTAMGGVGDDTLNGGDGDDTLNGDDGNDVLFGAAGADVLDGGSGNDDLRARDGATDRVTCGDGSDTVSADESDAVDASCETVSRGVGPDPGPPPGVDRTPPVLSVLGSVSQRMLRRGRLTTVVRADEASRVVATGTIKVRGRRRAIRLSGAGRVSAGARARLTLRMSARDRADLLRALRRGRLRARIRLTATDAAGNRSQPQTRSLALRR